MFCLLTLIVLSGLAVQQPLPLRQEPNTAVGNQESRQARETTLDHIRLQLRTVDDGRILPRPDKSQYDPKEEVWVEVLAINSDSKQVLFNLTTSFVHFLPHLARAGDTTPYAEMMQKKIKNWTEPAIDSIRSTRLFPNQFTPVATIKLSDWYDALPPGVYELKVKYRLYQNGPEIESDAVIFEIVK